MKDTQVNRSLCRIGKTFPLDLYRSSGAESHKRNHRDRLQVRLRANSTDFEAHGIDIVINQKLRTGWSSEGREIHSEFLADKPGRGNSRPVGNRRCFVKPANVIVQPRP